MNQKNIKTGKWFLVVGTLAGWFALIAQLYLTTKNSTISVEESLIRYFSYFTILTNILVAVCFTSLLFKQNKEGFFTKTYTLTATAVYISVVALIYNLILRYTWKPEGLQLVVNELLHAFIPLLFVLYWLIFVSKQSLKWRDTFNWLIYPFIYLMFILFRGSVSGFYPYPFVDVVKYGYETVFVNCFYVLIVFLIFSFLSVWIGGIYNRRTDG